MAKQIIGAQGEVTIIKIDAIPENMQTKAVERTDKGYIISHSENGNHHLLTGCPSGGDVMEREDNVPQGMRIIYAALENPHDLVQDAPTPHDGYSLDPGFYMFRVGREHDSFSGQARIIAD
jgi:hypothetical protein